MARVIERENRQTTKVDVVGDIVVFASGQGSNFAALAQRFQHRIACLVVNDKNAMASDIAERFQIPCLMISHAEFPDRSSFEKALVGRLKLALPHQDLHLILLAGFMRVLSETYFNEVQRHFPLASTLNIHPAHLFEYKGCQAYKAAAARRANRWGITIHTVTPELDAGPVLASLDAPVFPWESESQLRIRMQKYEHLLFVAAVARKLHTAQEPEQEFEQTPDFAHLLAGLPESVSVYFAPDSFNNIFNTHSVDKR